jgi:hypothetical protein
MKMFVQNEEQITVRTAQTRAADGTDFWEARFVLELAGGPRWHGVTTTPHKSRDAAEREALAMARSKQWALGASAHLTSGCCSTKEHED